MAALFKTNVPPACSGKHSLADTVELNVTWNPCDNFAAFWYTFQTLRTLHLFGQLKERDVRWVAARKRPENCESRSKFAKQALWLYDQQHRAPEDLFEMKSSAMQRGLQRISAVVFLVTIASVSRAAAICDLGLSVSNGTIETLWGPLLDPGTIGGWFEANFFHASLNDTFPTFPLLRISPRFEFYQLRSCAPEDVYKCMYHGMTSSLPHPVGLFGKHHLHE